MFSFFRSLLASTPLVLSCLAACAQDSTLTRLARHNHYALQVSGAQLGGPGWQKLRADVQKSQFVLVGEDHGLAQIPLFTAAVAQCFKPAVFVAEVDPYVAQAVTRLVAQPGPATAYLRRYPEALCFFDWAEEFELARTLRAQQVPLLGLDQVFITTSAPFYAQLAGLVKGKVAKDYFRRQASRYETQNQAFEKLGHDDFVMATQPQSALDSLGLLTSREGPAAQKMARDYALSYAIYKQQAHQLRVNLMKQNLQQALQPYQTATGPAVPKMLFKFGSNHLARGLSQSVKGEFYDVGNVVQNLADIQGQQSLHLYIIGKQGERAESDNPNFPARRVGTYTAAENPELRPFLDQVAGPAWSVFDLRPLRRALTTGKLRLANPSLERTILGYDYLIVIPETTASHAM
ncbi:MAG: hypothetical protein EOO36_05750 [Cytophagaceae bacterium]|nr:MAG: hypothetical protein EOO36_05750 [Cytophagaceae bacterium]